jgi:RHS repeat-associated protein
MILSLILSLFSFLFLSINIDHAADESFIKSLSSDFLYQLGFVNIDELDNAVNSSQDSDSELAKKIAGNVCPTNGKFSLSQTHYSFPGPIPYTFDRIFHTQGSFKIGYNGWLYVQDSLGYVCFADEINPVKIFESDGALLPYGKKNISSSIYNETLKISKDCLIKSVVNDSSGQLCAANNKKNYHLSVPNKFDIILTKSDGTKRIYYPHMPKAQLWVINSIQNLLLKEIILPSGHRITFKRYFDDNGLRTVDVKMLNPKGDKVFRQAKIINNKVDDPNIFSVTQDQDGRALIMRSKPFDSPKQVITSIEGCNEGSISYEYSKDPFCISKINYINGFWLENHFENERPKRQYPKKNKAEKGFQINSNKKLISFQKAPLGPNCEPIIIQRYEYYNSTTKNRSDQGYTEIYDALDNKTIFYYSKNKRITAIERYIGNNQLVQSEHMVWQEQKNDKDFTNLLAKYFKDENGRITMLRTFKYDAKGNVIEEKLYGNLTGNSVNQIKLLDNNQFNVDGVDFSVKYNTYDNSSLNLKLSDVTSSGVVTKYFYLEGTSLPVKELVFDKGIIKERCFLKYDEDNLLIEKIADDGSSSEINNLSDVTERRILRYQRKQEGVGIGMPYIVEEFYFDISTQKEVLMNKKKRNYHINGQVEEEAYFDKDLNYLFTLYYKYDDHARLIEETDPKGVKSVYRYDSVGNKSYESPRPDIERFFEYDIAGRLKCCREVQESKTEYTTKFTYNSLSQKISKEDSYGSIENYDWDCFGNLLKVRSSEVLDDEGNKVRPQIEKKYDAFGRVIEETDPKGFKTTLTYTIEDKPLLISYPDGTKEQFEYSTSGNLIRSISKTGLINEYEYDYRDREISKTVYDAKGQFLFKTNKTYKGWRLISETNPEGVLTTYLYDGAGRFKSTITNQEIEAIEYDALGEIGKKTLYTADDYIIHIFKRNKYAEVIEELVESKTGIKKKIHYEYDNFRNRVAITCFIDGPCKTSISYNARNEPVKIVDPLGFATTVEYGRTYSDIFNRYVGQVKETDPLGNCVVTLSDPVGRILSTEVLNKEGQRVSFSEKRYDLSSNLSLDINHVLVNNEKVKEVITQKKYGPLQRLEEIIEAKDTSDQKITRLNYNKEGLLDKKITPANIEICYEYDSAGLIKRVYSSGSDEVTPIDYFYHYTKSGLVHLVENQITHRFTKKNYDSYGHLVSETLENGAKTCYEYDLIGRIQKIILPDSSYLNYAYDGPYVKSVYRYDQMNNLKHTHTYEERDLSGHPTRALYGFLPITYSWNCLGKLVLINNMYHRETVDIFDPVGNILKTSLNNDETRFSYDALYQLTSEKGFCEHSYCFDSLNNRVMCDQERVENNFLNQTLKSQGHTFTYNEGGNLEQKGDCKFFFDALDRLVKVEDGAGEIYHYTYDAFDRRLSKEGKDIDDQYFYLGQEEIGALAQDGSIKELRVLGDARSCELSLPIFIELKGRGFIPIHDFRGSLRFLVDANSQKIVESYRISAFGTIYYFNQENETVGRSLLNMPWVFSGKRLDEETGFIFFGKRFFDPDLGSWITKDPSGFDDGPNLYAFVANNPVMNLDKWGLTTLRGNNKTDRSKAMNDNKDTKPSIIQNALDKIRTTAGEVVKRIGHEMPIPYIRLGVKSLGYFIEKGSFIPPEGEFLQESSKCETVGSREDKNFIMSFVNGIANTFDEAYNLAKQISSENDNVRVHLIHNSSHGVILDVFECMANIIGIPTRATDVVKDKFLELSKLARETNRRIFHIAHSQGGLLTKGGLKGISAEDRSLFDVVTYGSACILPKDMAGSVHNNVNLGDPVPWLGDWPGMMRALFFGGVNLRVLDHPRDAIIFDHTFLGKSYSSHWRLATNVNLGIR